MDLVEPKKNKLSRRKKARAKRTLYKAFAGIANEIENDQFLRSYLFFYKPAKNKLVVGGYIVSKNSNDTYNVYKKTSENLLHENLYSFDAAMAIAESLNAGHENRVQEILKLEQEYTNAYNDMAVYKYQYKYSLANDSKGSGIYEDRYGLAAETARRAAKNIRRFRIAKSL